MILTGKEKGSEGVQQFRSRLAILYGGQKCIMLFLITSMGRFCDSTDVKRITMEESVDQLLA